MKAKKKKREYRRFCSMSGHELKKNEKLVPLKKGLFRYFVNHKKRIVFGVCQFHAKLQADMMQRRLDRIHLRG